MTILKTLAAATAVALLASQAKAQVQDDRAPTPAERTAIEAVLRAEGFVAWDDVELDDGVWEIEDARTAAGREYDLKLSVQPLEIIERDADTED